ncbi:MAG: thioredoxin family protein [Thiogranum sp.]
MGIGRKRSKPINKYRSWPGFVGGLLAGVVICHVAVWIGGYSLISRDQVQAQNNLLAELQAENLELTEDLFGPHVLPEMEADGEPAPYDANLDARVAVATTRDAAVKEQKFLMITFGANWCMDCRNLHRRLKSEDVRQFTEDRFLFVNVDVGKFNQNADLAQELGVTLSRGIPVAIFFNPEGGVIGTTNEGQLEPARRYTSKQILRFIRDITERSQITTPDSVSG